MSRTYLYPFWVRFWHWANATLFVVLITTGISMHYSGDGELLFPFKISVRIHNTAGIALIIMYLFYFGFNFFTGHIKNYLPRFRSFLKNTIKQVLYYTLGIFKGGEYPFEAKQGNKFNPLQQVTYIFIMGVFMPLIIVSGLLLMFPQFAPDEIFGIGGIYPIAFSHYALGFFLTLFMIGHIYLATTGETPTSNIISMFTGWHYHGQGHEEEEAHTDKAEIQI